MKNFDVTKPEHIEILNKMNMKLQLERLIILVIAFLSIMNLALSYFYPELDFDFCLVFPQIFHEIGKNIYLAYNNDILIKLAYAFKFINIAVLIFLYIYSGRRIWPIVVTMILVALDAYMAFLLVNLKILSTFLNVLTFHLFALVSLTYLLNDARTLTWMCFEHNNHMETLMDEQLSENDNNI